MKRLLFVVVMSLLTLVVVPSTPAADHTINLRLTVPGVSNTVVIPSLGENPLSSIPSQTFTNQDTWYISSAGSGILYALVHSLSVPANLQLSKAAASHTIVLSQTINSSQAFLTFTSGDHGAVAARMESVKSGSFLSSPVATFATRASSTRKVALVANYTEFALQGNFSARRGLHTFTIEANSSFEGTAVLMSIAT